MDLNSCECEWEISVCHTLKVSECELAGLAFMWGSSVATVNQEICIQYFFVFVIVINY